MSFGMSEEIDWTQEGDGACVCRMVRSAPLLIPRRVSCAWSNDPTHNMTQSSARSLTLLSTPPPLPIAARCTSLSPRFAFSRAQPSRSRWTPRRWTGRASRRRRRTGRRRTATSTRPSRGHGSALSIRESRSKRWSGRHECRCQRTDSARQYVACARVRVAVALRSGGGRCPWRSVRSLSLSLSSP